jgi:hypothetical protein
LLPFAVRRSTLGRALPSDWPVDVDPDEKFQLVMSSWHSPGTEALPLKLDELCQKLFLYGVQDRVGHTLLV